ncbi:hypothetical protein EV421DRAFT_1911370 [Armillaria borealis]|uniref:TRIP4/RQT4 C2HC5-type zinc finger domain-containing protein n=1 Tax=Armillaria borealis TaxID=47425 RepID=A0AA39IWU6_9AGAR|nr:hypothetical protein EV421DRAFT_1911370 [Armillaria borealis]
MSTPWSSSGSLSSDRIKPRHTTQSQKQKQKPQPRAQPQPRAPKSKQLISLESLQTTTTLLPDPKGGCFCQAKEHRLSPYTPACLTCGLVLCSLNLPQHACPHCHQPPPNREALIVRLQGEIDELARREEEERERVRKAVGAFPALGGGGRATPTPPPPPSQHKVLSVNSKTKKVTVSSYTNTPVHSRPETPAEEEPLRVPPPPSEMLYAKRKVDPSRPFANYVGEAARYVPDKIKGKEKGKGKGKENEAGPS